MSITTRIVPCCFLLSALCSDASADMAAASRYFEKKEYAAALKEVRPLADSGNLDAQYNLGVMYDKGLGVARNAAEAVTWYRKAAERGQAVGPV